MSAPLDPSVAVAVAASQAARVASRSTAKSRRSPSPTQQGRRHFQFFGMVRLPTTTPTRRRHGFNFTFTMSCITWSLKMFHLAVSKLPACLWTPISVLCDNPATVTDPFSELLNILIAPPRRPRLPAGPPGPPADQQALFCDGPAHHLGR